MVLNLIPVESPGIEYKQHFPVDPTNLPCKPIKVYENALEDRNKITSEFRNVTGIYLWHNKVTGEQYTGSGYNLSVRLADYYYPSNLLSNKKITRAIMKYGHSNFSLVILEVCGSKGSVSKETYLAREQFYIDLFKPALNINPIAGSSLGFKHTAETRQLLSEIRKGKPLSEDTIKRISEQLSGPLNPFYGKNHTVETLEKMSKSKIGKLNPMYGKEKSPEFIAQQKKDKTGANNPMFGQTHSPEVLAKLRKQICVYDADTKKLIKVYPGTVIAKKDLKMGTDTLKRCCKTHEIYKGMIFSLTELSFDN